MGDQALLLGGKKSTSHRETSLYYIITHTILLFTKVDIGYISDHQSDRDRTTQGEQWAYS